MRELALRITSLRFRRLYDVDCQDDGNLEYDTYSTGMKHNLFNHYLAVLYRFKDERRVKLISQGGENAEANCRVKKWRRSPSEC